MRSEIEQKLSHFLVAHIPFTEECHVVYLLVEIRKLFEHRDDKKFPLLRFYADWALHTKKDRITPQIKSVMGAIYKEVIARQSKTSFVDPDPKLIPFASMMGMREEMDQFLREHGLPDDLILMKNWVPFQGHLASILADQPIIEPCNGIRKFSFKPAAKGCVIGEIEYEKSPGNFDIFKFSVAY